MTAFLNEHAKHVTLNKSALFHLRSYIKNLCFVFHQGFQTPLNNKSICLSVFGTPDETLALAFDILHEYWASPVLSTPKQPD